MAKKVATRCLISSQKKLTLFLRILISFEPFKSWIFRTSRSRIVQRTSVVTIINVKAIRMTWGTIFWLENLSCWFCRFGLILDWLNESSEMNWTSFREDNYYSLSLHCRLHSRFTLKTEREDVLPRFESVQRKRINRNLFGTPIEKLNRKLNLKTNQMISNAFKRFRHRI